jgi:hypothetical protein
VSKLTVRKFLLAVNEHGRVDEQQLFRDGFHFNQIYEAKSKAFSQKLVSPRQCDCCVWVTDAGRAYMQEATNAS